MFLQWSLTHVASVYAKKNKEGTVFYGQEPPSGESTTTESGVNYQLLAVMLMKQPNGLLPVAVDHSQPRAMASDGRSNRLSVTPTLHMALPKAPSLPPWDPLAWCKRWLQITRLAVSETRRRNLDNARWLCSYSGPHWPRDRILKTNYVHVSLCLHRNFGSTVVNHQRCTPKAFSEVNNLAFFVVKPSVLGWCHNKVTMDLIKFKM